MSACSYLLVIRGTFPALQADILLIDLFELGQPPLFSKIIIDTLFSKFGDELTDGTLQGGGCLAFGGRPVSAREAPAELTDSGNDEVGQSLVGKGVDEFIQLGRRQTRGQRVETLWFRSNMDRLRW